MTLTRTTMALCLSPTLLMAETPKVVTDFAPIHSLAAQVMDGVGEPELLLPQGADPHGFQMRPSQMRSLSDTDLLIWVGPALTPWLERAVEGASLGHSMALLSEAGTVLREGGHDHDHGDHESHEDEMHEDHDDHEHDDFDSIVVDLGEVEDVQALQDAIVKMAKDQNILRVKGYVAVKGKPMRYLVQAVGTRIRAQYDQPWGARPRASLLVVIAEHDHIDEAAIKAALGV